ncbi:hypothetical protein BDZ97DRAFT_1752783 [Flammula alnicola]|nr:hypothetical protein BDZ97DRAFT_1752783 [Flammula alnicola]
MRHAPTLKIGIALYNQSHVTTPMWALVFHPTSYDAADVSIHGIYARDVGEWVLRDRARSPSCIRKDPDLLGIIHVGDVPWERESFERFVRQFAAEKNGDNPGQVTVWSPSAWVIRVLVYVRWHYQEEPENNYFMLPCLPQFVHALVRKRIEVLRELPRRPRRATVIDLAE